MSDPYARLIEVAAQLVQGQLVPRLPEGMDWYISTPSAERRRLREESEKIADLHKDVAIEVRKAADLLVAERDRFREALQSLLNEMALDYGFLDKYDVYQVTKGEVERARAALEKAGV